MKNRVEIKSLHWQIMFDIERRASEQHTWRTSGWILPNEGKLHDDAFVGLCVYADPLSQTQSAVCTRNISGDFVMCIRTSAFITRTWCAKLRSIEAAWWVFINIDTNGFMCHTTDHNRANVVNNACGRWCFWRGCVFRLFR